MDLLRERIESALQAVAALNELGDRSLDDRIVRDALIQRFQFTFEAVWHAAKKFLHDVQGTVAESPKACIRASREAELMDDEQAEAALKMVDDRNATVHNYNEKLAAAVAAKIPRYALILDSWASTLERRLPGTEAS